MPPKHAGSWQGALLDLGQPVVGNTDPLSDLLWVECAETPSGCLNTPSGQTSGRESIWPYGPGERKEALAAHQDTPVVDFSTVE